MVKDYGDNDYRYFLSNASDKESLYELIESFSNIGYEGTSLENIPFEGQVNYQYEIVCSGSAKFVYDKDYSNKVFISGDGEGIFLDIANKELTKMCGGINYEDLNALEQALIKSNEKDKRRGW